MVYRVLRLFEGYTLKVAGGAKLVVRQEPGPPPPPFWLPYGYFGGGLSPIISTIDRIDYSNDTATALVKGPLSAARYAAAAPATHPSATLVVEVRLPLSLPSTV